MRWRRKKPKKDAPKRLVAWDDEHIHAIVGGSEYALQVRRPDGRILRIDWDGDTHIQNNGEIK